MTEKIAIDLGNVQKTLFLPLWGRAIETKKEKPMLVDPKAVEIIEKVDFDFSNLAENINPLSQFAWIRRSMITDQVIQSFVEKYPQATIVNIGCGLDTTFDRIDNGSLLWYDLDLPDVITLRRKFIPEGERRKFLSTSFLEEEWLREIRVTDNVLFIADGVFYYFQENEIKTFLLRLADQFPGSEILFDVSSPYGVKVANQMVIKAGGLDEKSNLTWGLSNPKVILDWDKRIRMIKTYFYFGLGVRASTFKIWYMGILSDSLKIQYMLHLGIQTH
jgi:O-methyltransferase involved in polyketide biosynthesis